MFKPGDKIKFIGSKELHGKLTVGKIYIVDSPCDMITHGKGWVCITRDDHGKHNGFGTDYYIFELIERIPITNDIEWLDRIQENFKV